MKRTLVPALVVAVGLTTYLFWRGTPASSAPQNEAQAPAIVVESTPVAIQTAQTATAAAEIPVAAPSKTGAPAAAPAAHESVREMAPSLEDMREEVKQDPHKTPASLLGFAALMHERLEAALQNPAAAESFFGELQDCVTGQDQRGKASVQAICMLNANRLQQKHGDLSRRYENLERQADPRVLNLMKGL